MKESLLQEHINDNDEYVKEEAADEDNRMEKTWTKRYHQMRYGFVQGVIHMRQDPRVHCSNIITIIIFAVQR